MALSRAFTTRKGPKSQNTAPAIPTRSLTTKHSFQAGTIRNKISGPMELISTTNMLSYNAPDLHPISISAASTSSGDESDIPSMSHSTSTTPDSSVRGSGSSNTTPISPSPN
ncbi:hypothetical protein V493_05237, partial [Pseudogymnoascus sp. VKM F-4281 (FW-2241)]